MIFLPSCKFSLDEDWVQTEQDRVGRFILACNDTGIDPESMLEYYKEQNAVERGFRLIKDKRFHVSEIYLKNENRIAALSMLMVALPPDLLRDGMMVKEDPQRSECHCHES